MRSKRTSHHVEGAEDGLDWTKNTRISFLGWQLLLPPLGPLPHFRKPRLYSAAYCTVPREAYILSLSIFLNSILSSLHHYIKCHHHDVPTIALSPTHNPCSALILFPPLRLSGDSLYPSSFFLIFKLTPTSLYTHLHFFPLNYNQLQVFVFYSQIRQENLEASTP